MELSTEQEKLLKQFTGQLEEICLHRKPGVNHTDLQHLKVNLYQDNKQIGEVPCHLFLCGLVYGRDLIQEYITTDENGVDTDQGSFYISDADYLQIESF